MLLPITVRALESVSAFATSSAVQSGVGSSPWELSEMQTVRPQPAPAESEPHLNTMPADSEAQKSLRRICLCQLCGVPSWDKMSPARSVWESPGTGRLLLTASRPRLERSRMVLGPGTLRSKRPGAHMGPAGLSASWAPPFPVSDSECASAFCLSACIKRYLAKPTAASVPCRAGPGVLQQHSRLREGQLP